MPIHFDESRWEAIRKSYGDWWANCSQRPLVAVTLTGYDPGRPQPEAPILSQQTALDLSWTPDQLIDRMDYELSKKEFLGDAFPYVNMDCFGPGVLSAFLGATPDNSTGSIWFHPTEIRELSEMHFTYQPDNVWFNRVKDLYRAANRRWHGQVIMGMVDLGGILDVLAVFRGTDNLLLDLYDEPEEVKRLVKELHQLWIQYYSELCDILEECNQGYTDWTRIYSEKRAYVLQCDFSYMIGNGMFREFLLDDLKQFTEELENTIYHMDGPGELNHFDDLLAIPKLNAIQWVPGAGNPLQGEWPEIYQRIYQAKKGTQIFDGLESLDTVKSIIGNLNWIQHANIEDDLSKRDYYVEKLKSYGIPVE